MIAPAALIERGILLKMRFELDQYINLRPFLLAAQGIDFEVIRENTEGTYAGEGGFLRKGTPHEIATQGSVNTRHRRRALHPLRLRAGPRHASAST